jgi:hypothetical protein
MEALMLALMAWLSPVTGLQAPIETPRIAYADYQAMVEVVSPGCEAEECPNVLAYYNHDTDTIVLSDWWSQRSLRDVSILAHELVHYMQDMQGINMTAVQCPGYELEGPAYRAQIAFLEAAGVDAKELLGVNDLWLFMMTAPCHV